MASATDTADAPMRPDVAYSPPQEPRLTLLHRDEDILVLAKPAGLLSVPGKKPELADCLESRVRERFPSAATVHRLDRDTSGVQVLSLNGHAQRHLGLQFERRKVRKAYVARVWGAVDGDDGVIDLPLSADWPNRPKQRVDHEHGRAAFTGWRVLARESLPDGRPATRLALQPLTGRSHQLRVHLLSFGHPILGDRLYAHEAAYAAADRLQLHALSLTLHHPADGRLCTFEDQCPF
jgi:tRNA pseudouridine32 synthase/23S rRNA pseudouridine746 synthase